MSFLILGGSGVFGSRLAELLVEDGHEVIVAGRRAGPLEELKSRLSVRSVVLDRNGSDALAICLSDHAVTHVIDAAGPFQDYAGYNVVEAALAAGCHYFDLSDDANFTAGIAQFDDRAKAAGIAVLSGVSSVPAISGAIITDLTKGWQRIDHIEAAIMPGNRAPRGRSVMTAILSQIGEKLRIWRGGQWECVSGWSDGRSYHIPGVGRRRASLIGAPDLILFPEHFNATTVEFRAGLELGVMHRGLALWSWLRHRRLVPPLKNFIAPLEGMARRLEGFGSDQGGMVVQVRGHGRDGNRLIATWSMAVSAGKGPFTPALPATILARKTNNLAGARPAISEVTRAEIETEFKRLDAITTQTTAPLHPLFQAALGPDWEQMPQIWRDIHDVCSVKILSGEARVTRGTGLLSRIIAKLFGFPDAADAVPVSVRMVARDGAEHWTRRFGERRFTSRLRCSRPGHLRERFGPFEFEMAVPVIDGEMEMPVTRGWLCGVPIPTAFLPRSETREYIAEGKFHFDVKLSAPGAGLIVHYEGCLE